MAVEEFPMVLFRTVGRRSFRLGIGRVGALRGQSGTLHGLVPGAGRVANSAHARICPVVDQTRR